MVFLIFWRVDTVRSSSSNSFRSAKYAETVSMQVRAAMGGGGVGRVGNRGGVVGVDGSENGNRRVVRGGGSGSYRVRGSGG